MEQYLDLLKQIKAKGTHKPAAREGMPGTLSLFGHQMRFDLSEGFPILTTKKLSFKNIVTELLWFLKGDTNIKYLVDNGCNIWNEDAYNYYKKAITLKYGELHYSFEEFIDIIKISSYDNLKTQFKVGNYVFGDCGKQYGWLWRNWQGVSNPLEEGEIIEYNSEEGIEVAHTIDQIQELIEGLQSNPMSRRHIISAWNPATLNDMALNACHCFVQFNCRPLTIKEQTKWWDRNYGLRDNFEEEEFLDRLKLDDVPKYYLDCQMYQRSADVFLGVPYNISSYALLTQILCKICNMVPGEFIHSFGDVHIYDNHMEQVDLQLTRTPDVLPKLVIDQDFKLTYDNHGLDAFIKALDLSDFKLENYNPQPSIRGKLSTGLK